jgi:hypothetical protein
MPVADTSPELVRQIRRGAMHLLVATFVLLAPVPFFLLFIVGLMPLGWIAWVFLRELASGDVFIALFGVHVVADVGILYLVSWMVCRTLFGMLSLERAVFAVKLLVAAQVVAACFPIYVLAGDPDAQWISLWGVGKQMVGSWP